MLKNYIKIAVRQLFFNRLMSSVSVVGLASGLTVALLIVLFVAHEYSYDRFHQQGDRIVKVELAHTEGESSYTVPWMSYRFAEAVKNACPEVVDVARLRNESFGSLPVQSDEQHKFFEANFRFADAGFLRLFSFPFVQGDPKTALTRPGTILLTESTARKYFGSANPLGKRIQYDKKYLFEIVGVLKDLPPNSTLQFDFLAQIATAQTIDQERYSSFLDAKATKTQMESIGASGAYYTYLLLHSQASIRKVKAKIPGILTPEQRLKDTKDSYNLYPLFGLHFTSSFSWQRAVLFSAIAFFVLILALINYINLATARSTKRAKEVAVRKVAGAPRQKLVIQFYIESALQVTLAFGLAILFSLWLKPFFSDIMDIQFAHDFLLSPFFIIPAGCFFIGCILLSGSYPALLLSSFSPIVNLKSGPGSENRTSMIRSGLTIFQFVVSITLIIGSILIKKQLDLFLMKDVGVSRERVLTIPLNQEEGMAKHYASIRQEIDRLPGVEAVTASSLVMYGNYMNGWDIKRLDSPKKVAANSYAVDEQFIKTMNIRWAIPPHVKQGIHSKNQIVINETAARALGINKANVNQTLDLGSDTKKELIGVVKDFNYTSLERGIRPMLLFIGTDTTFRDYLYVKLAKQAPVETTLASIRQVYDQYKTERPFDYTFLDDTYQQLYKAQTSNGRIIFAFTVFAILIACLGLFGLVAFTAEQRTKEIGVRKVLGASVLDIIALLSVNFLKLVFIALIIASPIAWFVMNKWLQGFAYKIDIEWWMFALAGLLAVGVALLTVSFQSIKAAMMNPVKSLRSE